MGRNALIKVTGLGLQEYFSRVLRYRDAKTQTMKLKDSIQANEEIADLGGASDEEKRKMREYNRSRFKESTAKMILDCRYLSLEYFPKEICDKGIRQLTLDNNLIETLPSHLFRLPLTHLSLNNNFQQQHLDNG